jgi:hypothetical protein
MNREHTRSERRQHDWLIVCRTVPITASVSRCQKVIRRMKLGIGDKPTKRWRETTPRLIHSPSTAALIAFQRKRSQSRNGEPQRSDSTNPDSLKRPTEAETALGFMDR